MVTTNPYDQLMQNLGMTPQDDAARQAKVTEIQHDIDKIDLLLTRLTQDRNSKVAELAALGAAPTAVHVQPVAQVQPAVAVPAQAVQPVAQTQLHSWWSEKGLAWLGFIFGGLVAVVLIVAIFALIGSIDGAHAAAWVIGVVLSLFIIAGGLIGGWNVGLKIRNKLRRTQEDRPTTVSYTQQIPLPRS